jgi:hypothetical protein
MSRWSPMGQVSPAPSGRWSPYKFRTFRASELVFPRSESPRPLHAAMGPLIEGASTVQNQRDPPWDHHTRIEASCSRSRDHHQNFWWMRVGLGDHPAHTGGDGMRTRGPIDQYPRNARNRALPPSPKQPKPLPTQRTPFHGAPSQLTVMARITRNQKLARLVVLLTIVRHPAASRGT